MTEKKVLLEYSRNPQDAYLERAAELHPNWTLGKDENGSYVEWLGGRKGPRTPKSLIRWFVANHPEEVSNILQELVRRVIDPDEYPAVSDTRH